MSARTPGLSYLLFHFTMLLALSALAIGAAQAAGQKEKIQQLQAMAPYDGYLSAHRGEQRPLDLLGGPLQVSISQTSGGVFVALPDNRRLDENVFGTPGMPRAFAGTPGINGVPPMIRGVANGEFTRMKKKSPFGDKYTVMANGRLRIQAVDRTATDAAQTKDSVFFNASWEDEQGNRYEVRCCAKL
ncbi:MAG: hypothetical protein GWO02_13140, partial [Gammaproteobacteria bacterium]|nr:hypothetical protein [Gammaproteobacteria bacterium]